MPDPSTDPVEPGAVIEAATILYSGRPDDFAARRRDLAAQAKASGDAESARAIGALRKPTVAAAVVNRYVHQDPDCVTRLLELGTRLREAHAALDAVALRDLSAERRSLVADLAAAALALAELGAPSAAQRDDVTRTFDAAVADPAIAARLGRLTRPESWSGFGVAAETAAPALTVLRGGKAVPATAATRGAPGRDTAPPDSSARDTTRDSRRARRAVEQARTALEVADAALADAEHAERTAGGQVRALSTRLADLQRELDRTKQELDAARREVRSTRTRRREARSALDRAERRAGS